MEDAGLLSGLVLFLVLSALGVIAIQAISSRRDMGFPINLFLAAYGVRFATAIVIYQFGLVRYLGDEDSSGWVVGKAYAQGWYENGIGFFELPAMFVQSYQQLHNGHYYLLGILFHVTNSPTRLAAAALNCFFGALTAVIGYRTAQTLFSERIGIRVGWWICFYPSLIIWSAQTVKEPVVIFLESLAVYGCVVLRQRGISFKHVAFIFASILLLIPFRFYAAYLAAATVIVSVLLGSMGTDRRNAMGHFVLSIGVAMCLLVVAMTLLGRDAEKENEKIGMYSNLENIERYRSYLARTTGSGVKVDYDLQTPGGLTASLAIGGIHLLFAPFPWQLANGSLRTLLVAPEIVLWWWLLLTGVLPGLKHTMRTRFRDILPLLIMVFGLGLLYSLMFGNIGLIYRQRAQLLPFLLIFAVVGRDIAGSRRPRRRASGCAIDEGENINSASKSSVVQSLRKS